MQLIVRRISNSKKSKQEFEKLNNLPNFSGFIYHSALLGETIAFLDQSFM